jgi:hypothetical protein
MIGVPKITRYIRELTGDPTIPTRNIYHWISKGHIPAVHLGTMIVGSKAQILERLTTPTNQDAADD